MEARKNGYWPIRKCFDAALPQDQELSGKVSLRFALRADGKSSAPAIAGPSTLADQEVLACLRKAFVGINLVKPRAGSAKVTLDIGLHPGDAPMRANGDPPVTAGPGTLDMGTAQALVAAGASASVQPCYSRGLEHVLGLWGRALLRAAITAQGTIATLTEAETTFPELATTACVADAIRAVRLSVPAGGGLRVLPSIRMGSAR